MMMMMMIAANCKAPIDAVIDFFPANAEEGSVHACVKKT